MYSHTQVGWWLLAALGGATLLVLAALGVTSRRRAAMPPATVRLIVGATFGLMALTTILFSTLNVPVSRDAMSWRFGPGLIRFTIPLSRIESTTPTRLMLMAGIRIHFIGSGWVYNVSGRDAVEITRRDRGNVWIGSDEPEAPAAAIERARAAVAPPTPNRAPR